MVLRMQNTLFFGLLAALYVAISARGSEYAGNIFLNGEFKKLEKSHRFSVNPASNVFLEHAIISRQAAPFQGPTYLPPLQYIKCGNGQQCVKKNICQNGYYTQKQSPIAKCDQETDVCCTYRPPATPPPTTPKPYVTCRRDQDCVSPADCQNGEITSPNYIHGGSTSTCYAPNVCCLMPSTTLTETGYQLKVPDTKFPIPSIKPPVPTPSQPTYTKPPPVYTNPPATRPSNEYLPPVTQPTRYTPPPVQTRPTQPSRYTPPPRPETTPQQTQRYTPAPPPTTQGYTPAPPQPPQRYTPAPPQPPQRYTPAPPQPPQRYTPAPPQPPQRYTPAPPQPPQRYTPAPPQPPQRYTPAPPQPPQRYTPPAPPASPPTQPRRPPPNRDYLPPSEKDNEVPTESRTVTNRVTVPTPRTSFRGENILSPKIVPNFNVDVPITPAKCASALLCTPEDYCNSIGVISDTPVDLSPEARLFRVPLTDCIMPDNGSLGKCCRDSNYVDPWPVNMAGVCGTRNRGTKPKGIQDIDTNFGEIPWQAMILKESTKSLLCGGAIVGAEFVLTSADCVRGLSANDCRVKAGEWELGNDSEPLPNQIVGAREITIHPTQNLAMIRLDKSVQFAQHIKPICIDDQDPSPSEQCITSGWGKEAIRTHEQGAIMHVTDTQPLSRSECGADQGSVCAATKFDACQFDVGSALACGTASSIKLKGIYAAENGCGEGQPVRFEKPDIKWINEQFTVRNKEIFKKFN